MTHFQRWKEWADMPTKDEHGWFDMETGERYDPNKTYLEGADFGFDNPKPVNYKTKQAQQHRQLAKQHGCKALTGTPPQKAWAEKLRKERLQKAIDSGDNSTIELMKGSPIMQSSAFWIENRELTHAEFLSKCADMQLTKPKAVEKVAGSGFERSLKKLGAVAPRVAPVSIDRIVNDLLNDTRHPATEVESAEIGGVVVRIFDIPSLSKQALVAETANEVWQGFDK